MTDPKTDAVTPATPETGPETGPDVAPPSGTRPPRARMGLGLRILLFTSLALNLAVAGVIAGFLSRAPFRPPPPRPDRVGGALTSALSEEDRRAIGRSIFQEMRKTEDEHWQRAVEYRNVLTALRAEPFDAAVLETSLARQGEEAMRMQMAGQEAFLDRIKQMSPQERKAFADRFEQALKREEDRARKDHAPRE